MSSLTYNDTTIPFIKTTDFRQEAVYDDLGTTDRYLVKFDITVQGILNIDYLNQIAPDLLLNDGVTPRIDQVATIMQTIRDRLLTPRRSLSMTFNEEELIAQIQSGNDGFCDAANGPKPQSCNIIQLTNLTFLIHYHIIAHYFTNYQKLTSNGKIVLPLVNLPGSPVLFNRWSEVQDIDHANFTTYTREGKFVIRSDNFEGFVADQLREQFAVVGVLNGCLRESSQYRVSPDGLAIEYKVVDKEVFRKPPPPAFRAEGYYLETTTKLGAKRFGEARVRLEGDKNTNQAKLLDTAITVVTGKLAIRGGQLNPANSGGRLSTPQNAAARIDLYRNIVEFSMTVLFDVPTATQAKGLAAFQGMSTVVPGSTGVEYTPPYEDRGSLGLLLQAAAYHDAALLGNELDEEGQMSRGFLPGTAGRYDETEEP